MSSHRVGIVGLSWITSEPANPGSAPVLGPAAPHSHLSALAAIPSATVVAGCDINPEARDLFHQRWEGTWPGLTSYADYNEMIRDEQLDLICVATPDHLHGDIVRVAAAAGIRAIFCEKPMSTNVADVDSMIEAIERHGAVVNVNHTRRWMPPYVAARETVRAGAIGDLVQVTVHFGGERAMLWRNHSHFLDLICYFAESDPTWVTAELEAGFEDYGTSYGGDGGRDASLEPGLNAYIAFANGVRAFLGGMKRATPQINVDLIGSEGTIHVDDQGATLVVSSERGLATTPIVPRGTMQGMQAGIADLIAALETGQEPQCPPREARKTVALIEGILASQAAGNARIEIG
jgi:predicted dehydrogenase